MHRYAVVLSLLALATCAHQQETVVEPAAGTNFVPEESTVAESNVPETETQLDQLVAPIALYPDALVGQILAASTYPTQISEAQGWMQQHSNLKGDELAQEVDKQSWDPSVKALTQFPSVLANMQKNLSWTSALGDAYTNQQQAVFNAVQEMRQRAQQAGNLKSTTQEKVSTQGQTIVIEPANPQVVYVPAYDPWIVYGPPVAIYPGWAPYGGLYAVGPGISFGLGFGVGLYAGFGWGWHHWDTDWHSHHIVFNHNTYISHSRTFINHGHGGFGHGGFDRGAGFHGSPARAPEFHGSAVAHAQSGAFSGFNHGGMARGFSARGGSSFGGRGVGGGGFHGGGGGHGGGGHR
jgi:hypothetical protein